MYLVEVVSTELNTINLCQNTLEIVLSVVGKTYKIFTNPTVNNNLPPYLLQIDKVAIFVNFIQIYSVQII